MKTLSLKPPSYVKNSLNPRFNHETHPWPLAMQVQWHIHKITFLYVYEYKHLVPKPINDRQYLNPLLLGVFELCVRKRCGQFIYLRQQ